MTELEKGKRSRRSYSAAIWVRRWHAAILVLDPSRLPIHSCRFLVGIRVPNSHWPDAIGTQLFAASLGGTRIVQTLPVLSSQKTPEQAIKIGSVKMNETETLFKLSESDLLNPWGDYGSVLCNGLNLSLKKDAPLQLGRTGPFVPPISFPLASDVIVVTNQVKSQLEESNLSGIGEFRRVTPEKLVSIPWDQWDRTAKLSGDILPFNGEPEEYILHNPHNEELSSGMEDLWSWHPIVVGRVIRSTGGLRLEGVLNAKCDVFRLHDAWWTRIIVNKFGKETISNIAGDWVTFAPANVKVIS